MSGRPIANKVAILCFAARLLRKPESRRLRCMRIAASTFKGLVPVACSGSTVDELRAAPNVTAALRPLQELSTESLRCSLLRSFLLQQTCCCRCSRFVPAACSR
jgi:hypothetical protein